MINYQLVYLTDQNKHKIFDGESNNVSAHVSIESFEEGQALYVDAECKAGISGEEGITVTFADEPHCGYVAIESHSPFWTRPFFGKDLSALPALTQLLLIKLNEQSYRCYMPVCDDTFKTVLRGCEDGFSSVTFSNCDGLTECRHQLAMVVAEGENPFDVVRDCATLAVQLLDSGISLREEKRMPEVLEYLGWCSWDALQYHISEEGLLEKAKEFADKKVPVRFAILDDMWGDAPLLKTIPEEASFPEKVKIMHASRLRTFDGDPERFPNGMKAAVDALKNAGIDNVGLWYPTTGYWKGFAEDNEMLLSNPDMFAPAKGGRWHKDEDGVMLVKPEPETTRKYFDILAKRAKSWGIDFVKVDNQGYHHHYKNLYPVGASARAVHAAIDSSAQTYFGGAIINCMGMPSECLFNRPQSAVSRCSDDFMPESREWFSKNVLQCAYNGLLQGQFYINDWDMWWTDDEQAVKNSLCRAISGGPIYVSDKIGRTRPELLLPLALSNGRILRPDQSAMPTADCLTEDPTKSHKPFKIFNRVGPSGLVAMFHIDAEAESVSGSVSANDAEMPARDTVMLPASVPPATIILVCQAMPFSSASAFSWAKIVGS